MRGRARSFLCIFLFRTHGVITQVERKEGEEFSDDDESKITDALRGLTIKSSVGDREKSPVSRDLSDAVISDENSPVPARGLQILDHIIINTFPAHRPWASKGKVLCHVSKPLGHGWFDNYRSLTVAIVSSDLENAVTNLESVQDRIAGCLNLQLM